MIFTSPRAFHIRSKNLDYGIFMAITSLWAYHRLYRELTGMFFLVSLKAGHINDITDGYMYNLANNCSIFFPFDVLL